ncbi:MAG: conjugal transfer protein [Clostridia bacterium]|nr:conjugal transfer protein [Clostridia bacterium]
MPKQMTPGQRRKANALIRKTCCNYDNGNCIALDDGEECVCVQSISYSLICKWFVNAVLPVDKVLYAQIMGQKVKHCAACGAVFAPGSNRAKYCASCAAKVHRRQKNASNRKRRDNADK